MLLDLESVEKREKIISFRWNKNHFSQFFNGYHFGDIFVWGDNARHAMHYRRPLGHI